MEKYMCFHVNFKHESTKTCMFSCHLVPTFTTHYIIMVKGLLYTNTTKELNDMNTVCGVSEAWTKYLVTYSMVIFFSWSGF